MVNCRFWIRVLSGQLGVGDCRR
ncbi:hypothetical protein F383_14976 [Gossypium arboreum]|uniref:Uncharacterized protein n=1 Tax=Gossypium arboreum TaxID=29729 RepID=A0A0B0NAR6_GOSAR|nr:hypothetical protein F383_14976 [Gossypium arboreum]